MSIELVSNTISISQADFSTTILRQYSIYVGTALFNMLISAALFAFSLSKIFGNKKASNFIMAFSVISIIGFTVLTLIGILLRDNFYLRLFVWAIIKNTLFLISIIGLNYIDNENQLLNSENENEKNSVDEIIN